VTAAGGRLFARLVATLFALAVLLHAPAGLAAGELARGPRPSWLAPALAWNATERPVAGADPNVVDLAIDDQIRLGTRLEHYIHRVRRVTSRAGVEQLGELELSVDPTYERLVLHRLEVLRDGRRIDAARTATIRILDAESEREARIYNGQRKVLFVLADLRVGDVIELEASFLGQNPVFGGRVARIVPLASSRPIVHRRARIVWPSSREVAVRTEGTSTPVTSLRGERETEALWMQDGVPAVLDEGDEPRWYDATAALAFSEFRSWAEVARWAAPLYAVPDDPAPVVRERIDAIAREHASAEARALAALRFVQDEVRYLGIELGESSHRPHSAAQVLAQRFGDCKDKVVLLVTLLRGLGIRADAALVDTDRKERVADVLPGPNAFDHVVARIVLDGRVLWVDPTRSFERGALGAQGIRHGRALVVAADTTDLETVAAPKQDGPARIVREAFRIAGEDATLEVASSYVGASADWARAMLAERRRSDLEAEYLEFYAKAFPRIRSTAAMTVEDDPDQDVLVTHESYAIQGAAKDGSLATFAESIASVVRAPDTTRRQSPLAVRHPVFIRHEIDVEGMDLELPEALAIEDEALAFGRRAEPRPGGMRVVHEIRSKRDHVGVADLDAHLEKRQSIRKAIDLVLERRRADTVVATRATATGLDDHVFVVVAGVLLGVLVIGGGVAGAPSLVAVFRRWRWKWRAAERSGETPARAERVPSRVEGERRLLAAAAPCGHDRAPSSEVTWSALVLDGAEIHAARASCTACGATRTRYFVVSGE
jgi:hypothetical protein